MYFDANQTYEALAEVESGHRHRPHGHPGRLPFLLGIITGWWLRRRSVGRIVG